MWAMWSSYPQAHMWDTSLCHSCPDECRRRTIGQSDIATKQTRDSEVVMLSLYGISVHVGV